MCNSELITIIFHLNKVLLYTAQWFTCDLITVLIISASNSWNGQAILYSYWLRSSTVLSLRFINFIHILHHGTQCGIHCFSQHLVHFETATVKYLTALCIYDSKGLTHHITKLIILKPSLELQITLALSWK